MKKSRESDHSHAPGFGAAEAPVVIVWVDASGRVVAHNDHAAEELLPPAPRDAFYFASVVESSDRAVWLALLRECRHALGSAVRDLRLYWKDGRVGFARVSARYAGESDTVCAGITDISDLKEIEEELFAESRRSRALLRETNHRTKNLLSIIRSSIELKARTAETPEARHIAHALRTQVASLQGAVEALTRGGDLSSVNVAELLGEIVDYLAAGLPEHVTMRYNPLVPDLPLTAEAATSLCLAVAELCFNAVEHAFPDHRRGSIVVRVGTDREASKEVGHVAVHDDGIGFDGAPSSTGSLGLLIVRDMVEGHLEGSIEWTPAGPGTTVRIRFPLPSPPS